jgi:arginyl-tRNA synthetase
VETIHARLAAKVRLALPPEASGDPQLTIATDARFGDYQSNAAMALAKTLRRNPRQVAAEIIQRLDVAEMCEPPEIAGAGFINFRLRDEFVAQFVDASRKRTCRKRSSSISVRRTSRSRCTSAISAARCSAMCSSGSRVFSATK